MLSITLRSGEAIKLGEDIIIKYDDTGRCKLAIDAPKSIKIERVCLEDELSERRNAEKHLQS